MRLERRHRCWASWRPLYDLVLDGDLGELRWPVPLDAGEPVAVWHRFTVEHPAGGDGERAAAGRNCGRR